MHIIAIAATLATAIHILLTFGIHEIRDWRKLGLNFFANPESAIDMFLGILRVFLSTVFNIDIAHYMVS